MDRRRNKQQKSEPYSKLDEFPEEFDDLFFLNHTVEQDKRIPLLRGMVYKKIKNAIIDRVSEYGDDIEIEDKLDVVFDTTVEFTRFQWAVIRDELLDRGFDAHFTFDKEKVTSLIVPLERSIDLEETLEERLEKADLEDEYDSEEETDENI